MRYKLVDIAVGVYAAFCIGSFTYCGIKAIYLPHGAIVRGICRNDIDLIGIMFD
jgi:hypothetical protein